MRLLELNVLGSGVFEQVVVDLPEQRRNKSPQRQPPPPSSIPPTHPPTANPQTAEPTGSEGPQRQGPVLQRPFSSRPDGGVGWVEPDEVLSTFAATAADGVPGVETDALQAQGGPQRCAVTRLCVNVLRHT